ncbi:amidohydrolase [Flexivirga endophytica]|uniref:Amidohydrolase n=1 Tax=Flexivirga endophytica TaxID=1849103 RepID=A0A916T310_9MICO|nr:amidohydrolase [Flexivirga endophytica]GGB28289.1 amidohydrolase [Flexivirga endophytica]GHB62062.1 amidohydrolase [Flexivirga endophytica]
MPVQVFRHARIRTGVPGGATATAIATEAGRIVAVGGEAEVRAVVGAGAELVDLEGACVLPGMYDAHLHTENLAESLTTVDLRGAHDLDEALRRIAAFTANLPAGEWVSGGRWDANRWTGRGRPTRAALDALLGDRPAVLDSVDGHSAWINSAALRIAGIDRTTSDPAGGAYDRDDRGEFTGIVRESAIAQFRELARRSSRADLPERLLAVQQVLHSVGLTSIHDIDGESVRAAYLALRDQGRLGIRVHKAIPVGALETAIEQGRKTGDGDDWVSTGPVKLFSDGALGSHSCHLTQPFAGTENHGMAVTSAQEMLRLVFLADAAGIAVATHAIGDRAAQLVLDAYEQVAAGGSGLRHRIEHAQHLRPDDIHRMAALGVVASMQPTHCTSDIDLVEELLGDRDVASYAWRDLLNAGAPLAFGSDAPVEDPNPFHGLYAAVTRARPDGTPAGGWQPEQRLGIGDAITAYTLGSAYAAGQEQHKGLLTPGRLADFIAVDTDPVEASAAELRGTEVLTTVVGGAVRWQR